MRQAERDQDLRVGTTTAEQDRIKELEREVRELRQANEILRKASAYFAQTELDRRFKSAYQNGTEPPRVCRRLIGLG